MIYQKVSADMKFVDREKEVESMQGILSQKVDKVEELLQNVAKCLQKILTMQQWSVHHS